MAILGGSLEFEVKSIVSIANPEAKSIQKSIFPCSPGSYPDSV